jgi:hypothetical protein
MSYDYSLFNAPGPAPMSSWAAVPPAPLGTVDDVKKRLAALFPRMSWSESGATSFGRALPLPDGGPECRFLAVRRITRPELEGLCRSLDVVAVDNQKVELIRPQ